VLTRRWFTRIGAALVLAVFLAVPDAAASDGVLLTPQEVARARVILAES